MRRGRPKHDDVLTPREWEVLQLIEERLTNEEIAGRLGISLDTAKFHVSEILTKLGVTNRREAAAWRSSKARPVPAFLLLLKSSSPTAVLKGGGWVALAAGIAVLGLIALGILLMQGRASEHLGKVAYVAGGDVWVLELPDGQPKRITDFGDVAGMPQWSASGEWLLVPRNLRRTTPGGFTSTTFWVMDKDGKSGRAIDNFGSWSPTSDELGLLTEDEDRTRRLVVENADGSNSRVVLTGTEERFISLAVFWSLDGEWLFYEAHIRDLAAPFPGSFTTFNRIRPNGADDQEFYRYDPLEVGGGGTHHGWSADGSHYLLTFSTARGGDVPITAIPVDAGIPAASGPHKHPETMLAGAPDGSTTALVTGKEPFTWADKQIALYDAGSGQVDHLTAEGDLAAFPAWSPDAASIFYSAADASTDASQPVEGEPPLVELSSRRIWMMDRDGSNKAQLTHDPRYRDEYPQVSADGNSVLFVRMDLETEEGRPGLWLLDLTTNELTMLVQLDAVAPSYQDIAPYHIAWTRYLDWWQPEP